MKKLSLLAFSLITIVLLISFANVSQAESLEKEPTLQERITAEINTEEKGGIDRQAILEKAENTDINKTIQNLRTSSVDSVYYFVIFLAIALILSIFVSSIRKWVGVAVLVATIGFIFINYTEDVSAIFIAIADKIAGLL